jgi:hypothetical protein
LFALWIEAVFMVIYPFVLIKLGRRRDRGPRLPRLIYLPINLTVGWMIIIVRWLFSMWSIYARFTIGRGTLVPLMATQQLVVQPPYRY